MSSESDQESGKWSSRTSDVDSTHYESDGSESDGYQGDDTDSDQSCGGGYWDEEHSEQIMSMPAASPTMVTVIEPQCQMHATMYTQRAGN